MAEVQKKFQKGKKAAKGKSEPENSVMEEGQEGVEVPLGDITGKHDVDAKADDESFDVDKEKESTKRSNKSKNPDVKVKRSAKDRKGDLEDFDMEKELAELESVKVEESSKVPSKVKRSGKDRKGNLEDFDMEKELAELETIKIEEPSNVPSKVKRSAKDKKGNLEDFDMEKELAELDSVKTEEPPKVLPKKGKKPGAKELPEDMASDVPPVTKAKETAVKSKDSATRDEDTKKDAASKKPVNKNVAAMKEQLRKIQEEKDRLEREEDERIRKEEEAEQKRLDDLQKEKERKEKKKQKEKERKERMKAEGKPMTAQQKQDHARAQAMIESLRARGLQVPNVGEKMPRPNKATAKKPLRQISDDLKQNEPTSPQEAPAIAVGEEEEPEKADSDSALDDWDQATDVDEENEEPLPVNAGIGQESVQIELTTAKESSIQKIGHLRSAVVCVLGHVDTGKTKILDKIRRTNVQDQEAGGITQQIGATMVPADAIKNQSAMVRNFSESDLRLPGLLIIDTPGHESFSNLRSRGSSLCDIAILVVDIMHGLEPQTIESLNMLKTRKTPFVVALNKIDRLFSWKTMPKLDIRDTLAAQAKNVDQEFRERVKKIIVEFAEQGLNAALFFENPDSKTFISMVPTSAHSGDGMGNLMAFVVEISQTMLAKRLTFSTDLQCTVLEVKELTGLGTTIDVILTNGTLTEGDTIVLAGFEGAIVTQVRGLLMPQPLKELRVKNPYEKHKLIHGAQGVKVLAKDLETCLAGLPLHVANTPEEQERYKIELTEQFESALKSIQRAERGVYVQASTLGSLEALLEFLRTSKIPYCGINIGPVHKKDVRNASAMLEHDSKYAVILAFDVKVEREAQQLADELGIRIFAADIIYHLFDRFTQYQDELKQKKREENKHLAIFPCKLKILPQHVFSTRDPIIVGVIVEAGTLKIGTPLTVPSKEFVDIGIVTSIEVNHKQLEIAKKGQEVAIKIEPEPGSTPKLLGRHFEVEDVMVSKISRPSIDVCKDYFRDDLTKADWALMVELKKLLNVF